MFLHGVPTELLGRVIVPDLVQRDIESLCDDLEEIEGGEDALRWVCDQNGMRWEWKRWDRKQRQRLTEKLVELTQHGVFVVLKKTSFEPACPVFHQVDGTWQLTWDGQRVYAARQRFAFDLEHREREEGERKAWQSRNQPPKPEVLVPATGPGYRQGTLGPHVGKEDASNDTASAPAQAGYSGVQQTQIEQALKDQRTMLEAKKTELATWDEPAKANFKKAFGTNDESARRTMQERIDKMLSMNKSMTTENFKPAEPEQLKKFGQGLFAYVRPNDEASTVFLGPKFWTAPNKGPDSKAGTLSHEMSHFTKVGGTKDSFPAEGYSQPIYGVSASRQLAQDDSALALRHADSFQYYLEDAK